MILTKLPPEIEFNRWNMIPGSKIENGWKTMSSKSNDFKLHNFRKSKKGRKKKKSWKCWSDSSNGICLAPIGLTASGSSCSCYAEWWIKSIRRCYVTPLRFASSRISVNRPLSSPLFLPPPLPQPTMRSSIFIIISSGSIGVISMAN